MDETGVVHGRFQIFHLDHLKYILASKANCKHLIVGITNPDPTLTRIDPADLDRSSPANNPLTYFERQTIVRSALLKRLSSKPHLRSFPFPLIFRTFTDSMFLSMPLFTSLFMTTGGKRKKAMFESLGLKIHVLWVKPIEQKGIRATEIRRKIAAGEPWEHLVLLPQPYLWQKWASWSGSNNTGIESEDSDI